MVDITEVTLQVNTSGLSYRVVQSWDDTSRVNYGYTPLGWAVGVPMGVLEWASSGIDCIRTEHPWGGLQRWTQLG